MSQFDYGWRQGVVIDIQDSPNGPDWSWYGRIRLEDGEVVPFAAGDLYRDGTHKPVVGQAVHVSRMGGVSSMLPPVGP